MKNWVFNPDRTTERKLIKDMVTYLLDDLHTTDSAILRFVYQEWPLLISSMNSKTTVNNARQDARTRYGSPLYPPPYTGPNTTTLPWKDIQRVPTTPTHQHPALPMDFPETPIPDTSDDTSLLTPTPDMPDIPAPPDENQLTQSDVAMRWTNSDSETPEDKYHGDILSTAWKIENVSPMPATVWSHQHTPHSYGTVTNQQDEDSWSPPAQNSQTTSARRRVLVTRHILSD